MATAIDDTFTTSLARLIGEIALDRAKQAVLPHSKTLFRAMHVTVIKAVGPDRHTSIEVPHYWAIFLHDGSKSVPPGKFMVWYKNPADDPRFPGDERPERLSQIRKVPISRLRKDMDAGKVVIARSRSGQRGTGFFNNHEGMFGVLDEAEDEVSMAFRRHLRRRLSRELGLSGALIPATAPGESLGFGMIEDIAEGILTT